MLHALANDGNDAEILLLLNPPAHVDASPAVAAHVDELNEVNSTPLFYAANGGHLTTVKILVEHGADVNKRNIHGQTPLMWAVLSKNEALVQYLIEKGAKVDAKGEGGLTAYGLSLVAANPLISTIIRSNSDNESLASKASGGRKFSSDSSASPSSFLRGSTDEDEFSKEGALRIMEARRAMSVSGGEGTKKFALSDIARSQSFGIDRKMPVPEDPPTIRFVQNMVDFDDAIQLNSASINSLDISLVPSAPQTKEIKSTYGALLKRKILGEFLVKRGGMRTNWKCRYFLLTGDHLHYFEPQMPSKSSDDKALLEPLPNALPLGSISLHSITGNVHKSDLGIVFCFQVPTAGGRVYHIKAPSARSIERWTNVLNSNVKRIQGSSSKFAEIVFRISTTWKSGLSRSVLRTGREYQTMDAIITDYFQKLPDPPQFPSILLEEQPVGSQEMLTLLADYIKGLMRAKDDALSEQVSKFITDQSAEFFAIESRQELTGIDVGAFDFGLDDPVSCLGLSSVSLEKVRTQQYLAVCDYNKEKETSGIHLYEYDGCPIQKDSQHKIDLPFKEALSIHFGVDNSFFAVSSFSETAKPGKDEMTATGPAKFVGNLDTVIFSTQMLEQLGTLVGGEFVFDREPAFAAQDHIDTISFKKKGALLHFLVKVTSSKTLVVWNVMDKLSLRNLTFDLKGVDKINAVKFNKKEANMLAVATDQGIQIWDYIKGELMVSLKHPAVSISFSLDGKRISGLGAFKSKVKVWEARTGRRLKKLGAGFSTLKDDPSLHFHPNVDFHPKNQQMLVISSFGDLINWSYDSEAGEETQTVMNVEHMLNLTEGESVPAPVPTGKKEIPVTETELILQKAKSLEPAIFAECKGCVTVLAVKTTFARYFFEGLLVVSLNKNLQQIDIFLTRNGELVCSFQLENPVKNVGSVYLDVSHDGRYLTYADGNNIFTRSIPVDRNGDIIETKKEAANPEEEEEEKFVAIGWVPRHIENDPMIPYNEHQLIIAIAEDNRDKVKKLILTHNLNVNFYSIMNGWTPLTLASKLGQNKTVRTLIKAGADVSMPRRDDNMRPIHASASSGDAKTVLALIENGANPNVTWDPVYSDIIPDKKMKRVPITKIAPLHIASVNGFAEIIEVLLSCGAAIEAKDSNDRTPIIYAASKKENFAAVQLLVKKGADCTARGRTGTTAMHEAARADSQKMVSLLLKEGAEAENERNSRGETAVDLNPQLFLSKKYERYLRSDTKTFLKYQVKMKSK